MFINKLLGMVSLLTIFIAIGCDAQVTVDRSTAFKRAQGLDNGVSISWLEQTWNKDILDKSAIKASDFQLLKQLGFKCIRLPVAFRYFQTNNIPIQKVIDHIDQIISMCHLYGFK